MYLGFSNWYYNLIIRLANDKNKEWILAGISKAFTLIPMGIWNLLRFDTNVSKSAHTNINRDDKFLLLLGVIYN